MPAALTRDQIVDIALKKAGNTSITALANEWLANLLDRLYEDHRWPFLQKSDSGTLSKGQVSVDLPADFSDVWNTKALVLEDQESGARNPLHLLVPDAFDILSDPDQEGEPHSAILDLNSLTWRSYPLANRAFTWRLRYKLKPARLASNIAPTFPNDQLLIQGVFADALDHEDDARAKQEFTVLARMVERYKKGKNISPAQGSKVILNSKIFGSSTSFR
jgi:hypothetical protein